MTHAEILSTLKKLKPHYEKEGILLLGIFGSYANNSANESSDIDILIETTPAFLKQHKGFRAFAELENLKTSLKAIFQKEIDIVDKQGLKQHNNHYILEKTLYVS